MSSHRILQSLVGARSFLDASEVVQSAIRSPKSLLEQTESEFQKLAWGILDCVPLGVILLDSNIQIRKLNVAARSVLSQRDGLFEQRQKLVAADAIQTGALHKLVTRTRQMSVGTSRFEKNEWGITINRPSMRRPYEIVVASAVRTVRLETTVIFLFDPDREMRPEEQLLSGLYGLTEAESRVAVSLMRGKTLEEIASGLGIAKETVRKQLQNIFGKTGTNRQSELVRLLVSGPASLCL